MELKPGYKKTEVGVIPGDWEVLPLQDICRTPITYGIVQCGPHIPGGVPYVRVSDMDQRDLNVATMLRTSTAIASQFSRSCVQEGDIVYALRGVLGEVRLVTSEVAGANLTQGTARIAPKENLGSGYLIWAMRNAAFVKQAEQESKGTTFREITLADLRRLKVQVPPLPEQRAIATALSDVDALLAKLDQLLAKKRDLKQAAMQELLTGRRRLPGFVGEWETVTLGELFKFRNGLNKGKEFFGFGTPIVNYMDVYKNPVIRSTELQGCVSLSKEEIKAFDVKLGDVFFTRTSETPEEIGLASVMVDQPENTVFSGFVLRARPVDARTCSLFNGYVLRADYIRKQITSKASYTTRALTNGRLLSAVQLELPEPPEQEAIASVLSTMDAELTALEARREKVRAVKQGMMQELLTGRIRLV